MSLPENGSSQPGQDEDEENRIVFQQYQHSSWIPRNRTLIQSIPIGTSSEGRNIAKPEFDSKPTQTNLAGLAASHEA